MEAPASSLTCSPAVDAPAAAVEKDGVFSQVDPFLVEALENPRHRLTVLRMELDIQRFMQNSDQYQFEFQHFPTSYLRRAAHRVAQHYGLQTMASDSTADVSSSRIVARRTPESRFPSVCLSDVLTKQPEKEMSERVKIAIRPRPSKAFGTDEIGLGSGKSLVRTVEERKEQYDKARARIFSGSITPDVEGLPAMHPSDGISFCSSVDEQECYRIVVEENVITGTRESGSRVAIFRDSEKDRSDPDYDRSYDRYARGLTPRQNFCFPGCNVVQPLPYLQYEAGFSQMGQLPMRNPTPVSYRPTGPAMNHPFGAFGLNQNPKDAVLMQWPSPATMYAQSYDHFRHAIFQPPFYQHTLSFEHYKNC